MAIEEFKYVVTKAHEQGDSHTGRVVGSRPPDGMSEIRPHNNHISSQG